MNGITKIGRITGFANFQIRSKYISKEHCTIEIVDGQVTLHNGFNVSIYSNYVIQLIPLN